MERAALLLLLAASAAQAQQVTALMDGAPVNAIVSVLGYDGNGNLKYVCQAQQLSAAGTSTWSVSGATLSNVVVSSGTATATFATAPGLYLGALLTVSGVTALNGSYPVTGVSGATATFATTAANGTYNAAALTITTTNPLLGSAVWAIRELVYNGSGQLVTTYWAGGIAAGFGSSLSQGYKLACSNAGSY